MEFERYKERVKVLHEMLRAECKDVQLSRMRRDLSSDVSKTQQEVEIILYERMTRMLIECRKSKSSSSETTTSVPTTTTTTTTTTTPTTTLTTTTTTTPTTTTALPTPEECKSAINLTEFWRQDDHGSAFKPNGSTHCDTASMIAQGRPWFRFSGAAGHQMLDHCPPAYSCATHAAVWTDAEMPETVGVATDIVAYASWDDNCKRFERIFTVIRCSAETSSDVVYKFLGDNHCTLGFCSMFVSD